MPSSPLRTAPGAGRRRRRSVAVAAAAVLAFAAPAHAQGAEPQPPDGSAPGAPGGVSTWTTGAKNGVGTSATLESLVWHTLTGGIMTEVYYPTVDVANVQDLQLVVSDGATFSELERDATEHEITLLDDESLAYRQVNTDADGRYRVTKTTITDPRRSTVLIDVRVESLDGGTYTPYVLYNPSLANTGSGDTGSSAGQALLAQDGDIASALVATPSFTRISSGFSQASDGWTDLRDDHTLDWTYATTTAGNLVQIGQLRDATASAPSTAVVALGFGASTADALATARQSLHLPFVATKNQFDRGWRQYVRSLHRAPASVANDEQLLTQYNVALMTLKAHEDKTYRGANIASLTVPWGEAINADNGGVGGYHLVWSRDLYQVATAQLAAGDVAAANRSLDYLFDVQQKPDGSFPQNSYLDGTPYWTSVQLDEVAFPIVLAWQLGRDSADDWEHVKAAADYIVANGPATPQERWEEEGGYSPSTIAAEIAGLVAAAEIARASGDDASAALYLGVADSWRAQVVDWTFTTTGPHGDGHYFVRIDANGSPNGDDWVELNNGGGWHPERSIVDAGFLELVRLGIFPADDPHITGSLPEVDDVIKVTTPNGDYWYRYNHDGYGEKADGAPYDGTGVGRLWPLLSGERGEYELAAGGDATSHLLAMANAANDGWMIPEQVWDREDLTAYGFELGEGTGSATPLAWSMAQYVRLALSIDAGAPVETPAVVHDRYVAGGGIGAGPELSVTAPADGSTTDSAVVTVTGTTTGEQLYVNAGGTTWEADVAGDAFAVDVPLSLGRNGITLVAVGADGGTAMAHLAVTSTNFGTEVGTVADPSGDDNGPGTYVYPTNGAFNDGAFDVTEFGVYDDGAHYNFVTTIDGELLNPWGGDQMSVQRVNVYVSTQDGEAVPALPGTNADVAAPYDFVLTGDGWGTNVRNAAGDVVGSASLLGLQATDQIVISVPKATLGDIVMADASYAVVMLSHAAGDEGVGDIRPVYSLDYWQNSPSVGMGWIQEYRFGGGAGEWTGDTAAKDTDTSDPNALDVLVPDGMSQSTVLDWTAGSPVVIPYVTLG